jgi:uncharacterized protein
MTHSARIADWSAGEEGIAYQSCPSCGNVWYFRRGFCPRCGSAPPNLLQASGLGIVYATTLVTRAPSEELRAHAPYAIVLVDADEGFRLMGHAAPELRIGDRARCRFIQLAGKLIPYFERAQA